ncbi:MAG TPA: UDP-glucose/GDP-mannose dehydrogenase family protein, partial [Chthoniobacterales bacterium]
SQRDRFVAKVREALWVLKDKRIAVWGITFKSDTDDVRTSVAVDMINDFLKEGAHVTAYDPKGMDKAMEFNLIEGATLAASPLEAAQDAEALVIATEWPEFASVDLGELKERMHSPIIFDGRNLLDPARVRGFGFTYTGIGRP